MICQAIISCGQKFFFGILERKRVVTQIYFVSRGRFDIERVEAQI